MIASRSEAFALAEAGVTASGRCLTPASYTNQDPQFAIATASVGGTPSDPTTCNPSDVVFGVSIFSGGVSGSSLRTGELNAWAEAGGAGDPSSYMPNSFTVLVSADSFARLNDRITVTRDSGGGFSTNARIKLHIDGTLTGYSVVNASLLVGRTQVSGCAGSYSGACSTNVVQTGPFSFDLVLNAPVSSSSPTLQLTSTLIASAINAGVADASSTATLSIQLPAGFSFTSESGVLLVPEPPLLALSAGVLAMLLGRRRS